MEIYLNFYTLIHLFGAVLGLLSGFILLYFGIKSNQYIQPLAIGQIVSSIAIFVNFSLISQLIFYWPFMYRLGHVCILIFLPMPLLFVVFHTKNRVWRWHDLIHFIPLIVFFIDYGHVLLMSNAEKILILQEEVKNLDLLGQFRHSKYIGAGFHEKFRSFLFSFYWVIQVILFNNWIKSQNFLSHQNKVWKNWTMVFIIFQFCMFLPVYLSFLGLNNMASYQMANSFLVIWLLLSSISLFFYPSLLYGNVYKNLSNNSKLVEKIDKSVVIDRKLDEVMRIIDSKMDELQLYLKEGYSISDLSNDIGIPVYQISKCLNYSKGVGFVDFINEKRILYCVFRLDKGDWLNYTLEAISNECGFHNRNTFTRAFKKFQGCYPSEYKKKFNS